MRRLMYFFMLVILVGASATCVNASTDCERWFAAYRSEMAHAQQLKRIAAAKRRAQLYARRKLAGYIKPKPVARPVHPGPRMPRRQAIHHIDLACGVLPESIADEPVIAEEEPAEFRPIPDEDEPLLSGFDEPGILLPEEASPTYNLAGASPASGGGGGAPLSSPPFTSGGPGNGNTPSGSGGTPPPVTTPIPEPGNFILILTGAAGAAGVVRRRWKA